MKRFLLPFVFLFISWTAFAQGEIPVNMYTGTPGIYIPIYTITDHDLSESIALSYSANDLNLGSDHTYGIGWSLSCASQQISRQVRGLPDDFYGVGGDTRKGWLNNSNYSSILSFANSSDLSTSTCSDELTDNNFIQTLNYKNDTEPDLFSFSVGGYSGHFVFGNDGAVKLIPYQDILIVPTIATDHSISSWTITTNAGIIYTLSVGCSATRTLTKTSSYTPSGIDQTMLNLLERDYQLYSSQVSYSSAWMLSSVASPTGASITYKYAAKPHSASVVKNAQIFDASWTLSGGVVKTVPSFSLMTEATSETSQVLDTITASSGMYATIDPTAGVIKLFDPARSSPNFKNFLLEISKILPSYTPGLLLSVTESDPTSCNQMPPYRLFYNGNNPAQYSTGQDFWGFNNSAINYDSYGTPTGFPTIYVYPNEAGKDRYRLYRIPSYSGPEVILVGNANLVPSTSAAMGALSRLVYPQGGESDFVFEGNTFYDSKASLNRAAGGLRLRSITYFDGVNPGANIIKNFSYVDSLGHSTGKLISMPSYALPVWQYKTPTTNYSTLLTGYTTAYNSSTPTNTLWRQVTVVTDFNVSPEDFTAGSTVGYTRVSVARPGTGKAVFDYYVPAAYGDAATGSNGRDWSPTTMKFARPATCPSMNVITQGETYGYPTFPHAFYDYERGLLQKKSEYNESGVLVRKTLNTYQYLYKSDTVPVRVIGLAYDRFANTGSSDVICLYGRYSLLTQAGKVVATETVTTYDENASSRNSTESVGYSYSSPYHKLLSRIDRTAADGTIYGTALKYTLDYPMTGTPTDSTLLMIKWLVDAKRYGSVIEQVTTIKPYGLTERTTGATLIKYRAFGLGKPLVKCQLSFRPAAPTSFTASGVSSNVFTHDSHYDTVMTINGYTSFDIPLSSTGENRITSGALWGYNNRVPVVKISQARTNNIAFSDFETTNGAELAVTNGFYGPGRTGSYGIHPIATLVHTMTKPTATNYLLSFWLKNTSGTAVTLQVVLKNGSGTTLTTNNYSFTPAGTDYQYFTKVIDVSSVSTSTFSIQIQGQSLSTPSGTASTQPVGSPATYSSTLLPLVDDIGFYPDYAALSTVTYDLPFGVKSSTDPSGKTAFTTYDALGRAKFVSDQDHNIRQRMTYNFTGQVVPALVASVTGIVGNAYISTPFQFVAQGNDCIAGATYEWDFGSGYSSPSTSTLSPSHTYSSVGTDTVKLRVRHPDYIKSDSIKYGIAVTLAPLGATLGATGVAVLTNGTVTSSYGDFTNTSPPDRVTFKIMSVANQYSSTLTYQWKTRPAGTSTWTNTGSNSNTLGPTRIFTTTASYEIMCTVSSSDGRTANTGFLSVTISNP